MERLKLVVREKTDSTYQVDTRKNPHQLEDFKAVVRNLTENALKIVNKIAVDEMSKSEPNTELVEEYYLIYHYLDYLKRFASSKG